MVTFAVALFDGSATLTALTLTGFDDGTAPGAVYSPAVLMVPTVELPPAIPFTFHVTRWSLLFCTVARNWAVRRIRTVAETGEIVTLTWAGAWMVTLADPVAVGVDTVVACTCTVAGLGTADGAEYRPLESTYPTSVFPPGTPFTDQVAGWLAVNCWIPRVVTTALDGVTTTDAPCWRA